MSIEKNMIENGDEREVAAARAEPARAREVADDSAFLSGLNLRMKNADWSRYERGNEEFFGIDHDLERLSKEAPEKAVELWDENAPRGMRKPFYLEEITPEKLEKQQPSEEHERLAKPAGVKRPEEGEHAIPDALKKKFLEVDNAFYFREGDNKLAFKDRGRNMVTEHNDPDVARSMVELAEAKGWTKITVKGHEDFKREVWLQASLKGLDVAGYEPKGVDLAKLEELQKGRLKNVIEKGEERDIKSPGQAKEKNVASDEKAVVADEKTKTVGADRGETRAGVVSGKLLEHGAAPYDFDDKNERSYFVKVETPNGTKMHWGVDLERAIGEANVKSGEVVELERLDKKDVTVAEKQFDDNGKLVGVRDVAAERVTWRVKGEAEIAAENVKEFEKTRTEPAAVDDPKFRQQVQALKDVDAALSGKEKAGPARFAEDVAPPAKGVEKTAAKAVEAAPELKGEYKVAASVMAEVLREKGYSAKTVDKALAEATKRLDVMSKTNTPAPVVKMYDKDAPREVVREKMQVKSKAKDKERSIGGR